ncbi:MAG: HAMP domain-containing histidine kinase [Anaerolineales bacterium]|nr:HAMP domain-containing histidine kinase [Anaerolineales bacterium]
MSRTFEFPDQVDMTRFISEQAHDLKSPFNRILGFTKVVLNGLDGPINEIQKEDLGTVFQNSSYALALMSGLVDMARLSLGEKSFNPIDNELDQLFEQAVRAWQTISPANKETRVDMIIKSSSKSVSGDEILLRQLLVNFLAFVTEYIIDSSLVSLTIEDHPEGLLFTVAAAGKNRPGPSDCDLTMFGFIGQKIIDLHNGKIISGEGDEQRAEIRFVLPN